MERAFSVPEVFRFGWEILKDHSGLLYKVFFTVFAVQVLHSIVVKVFAHSVTGAIASVVLIIVAIVLCAGATRIAIRLARREPTSYVDIIPPLDVARRFFVASIFSGIVSVLPLIPVVVLISVVDAKFVLWAFWVIVCIVLGVASVFACTYLALRYSMVRFAALDGAGIRESFRLSTAMTSGQKTPLLLLVVALVAFNLVGAVLFLVGLLISIPVSMLAVARVYVILSTRVESKA